MNYELFAYVFAIMIPIFLLVINSQQQRILKLETELSDIVDEILLLSAYVDNEELEEILINHGLMGKDQVKELFNGK